MIKQFLSLLIVLSMPMAAWCVDKKSDPNLAATDVPAKKIGQAAAPKNFAASAVARTGNVPCGHEQTAFNTINGDSNPPIHTRSIHTGHEGQHAILLRAPASDDELQAWLDSLPDEYVASLTPCH